MFDAVWDRVAGVFGKGLGKYRFIRLLNTGSMARVWVGVDSYSRTFAIKVALKNVGKLVERLRVRYREGKSEGEITCELTHPNIVRGIEFGRSSRGEFLVMELVEGDLMKDRLNAVSQTARDGDLSFFIRLAHALEFVHRKGFVHRDFNPRNIFIVKDGRPKLFDFGLAVAIKRAMARGGNRTGTLAYMAPEVLRRLRSDQRADIYAFGIMLYETIVGQRPIQTSAGGGMDMIMQVLNAKIPEPARLYPDIKPGLNNLIVKAMAVDPADRFASAAELGLALRRLDDSGIDFDREYEEFERLKGPS